MAKSMLRNDRLLRIEDAVTALSYLIGFTGVLAAARHTGFVYTAVFFVLVLVALVFDFRRIFPVPRGLLTLATLLLVAATFLRMSLQNFVLPVVEALMILLAIKFLGEKKFRDYMQIYVLSVFLLAGSALLSLNILFLAYFFVLVFLLAAAMVFLAYHAEDRSMKLPLATVRSIAVKSLFIPLASIPLAALLFVILPRTSYPVFTLLNRGGGASTGFSDTVGLGRVSSIQENEAVIMRVEMEKVDDDLLYWRGIVLDMFDGKSWKSTDRGSREGAVPVGMKGRRIAQTVYLDPYGNRYLFALDKPLSVGLRDVVRTGDLTYSLPSAITRKLKYEAVSVLSDTLPDKEIDRGAYLQLPATGMARIKKLVRGLGAGGGRDARTQAILRFLKDGDYRYSLAGLPPSGDPLEDFLFRNKYGNCEYFASAMAVMLRLSGIPARLVGGYRGGFYNPAGGYYLIPQRNAHVWVEAYFGNRGWVRLDPTPAAPENYVSASRRGLLFRARLLFDAVDYYWNAFVINYDLEKQLSLANSLRAGLRDFRFTMPSCRGRTPVILLVLLGAGSLCLVLYGLLRARKPAEERLLALFRTKMRKRGYVKTGSQGLEEFVVLVEDDALRERARHFVEQFEGYFYRDRRLTGDEERRLRKLLDEL